VTEQAVRVPTAQAMRDLGVRLGGLLRAGDLVILSGDLGAGKTTLVQGIGEGLKVRGPITSPTFVIARVHPPLSDGPPLVHADAYRLGGLAEVDDLDLDASMDEAVTVVEWGEGLVEDLAAERLEMTLVVEAGETGEFDESGGDAPRIVGFKGVGERFAEIVAATTRLKRVMKMTQRGRPHQS
jgi:tRNA threonylcarbamoyladenosine biosynthesis protein TsaE